MPHDANNDKTGGGEEDEGAAAEQRGGEVEADGGSRESESSRAAAGKDSLPQFQTYKEAARKYYLQLSDNNMVGGHRRKNQHIDEAAHSSQVCARNM